MLLVAESFRVIFERLLPSSTKELNAVTIGVVTVALVEFISGLASVPTNAS